MYCMMTIEAINEKLDSYKVGTFVNVVWEKDISSAKAKKQGIQVMKRCEGVVRAGITYANIGLVKELMAMKSEEENESKKPSWFEHIGRGLVQHKSNPEKKYMQLFFVNNSKIKSIVSIGGVEKSPMELYEMGLITKADMPKEHDEPLITMTLSLDNIVSFGK